MPHSRHKESSEHHHGGSKHRSHASKKPLKASSMATRNKSGSDSKKLLTKTYSEIGVANKSETPTPSEKVSKWHRDILLVSPNQNPHPRQCICDQCMAEYGTYRIYNQLLDINPNSSIIKIDEEAQQKIEHHQESGIQPPVNSSKNDKVGHFSIFLIVIYKGKF